MSGFIEKRASGASERSGHSERVLTWQASCAMLPLVERIARDITAQHQLLETLRPELASLEQKRRQLDWAHRSRRYHLEDEIVSLETRLKATVAELEALGLILLDPAGGLVGFPTLVNQRRAYFSWQPGEQALLCWNYAGDSIRRPVPEDWTRPENEPRVRTRSRVRKK